MNGVTCPIDGCNYQGTPRSVEAHISSNTDEPHSGEVGRAYRGRFGETEETGEPVKASQERVAAAPEETDPAGVPIPVSATVLLVAVAVVVFVLVLRSRRGQGSEPEESEQRQVMR